MKTVWAFLMIVGLSVSSWAAPNDPEIQLEDIQEELMAELDTVEITDEDEAFFEQEIEGKTANTTVNPTEDKKSSKKTATSTSDSNKKN